MRRYGGRVNTYPPYPDRRSSSFSIHADSRSGLSEKENMEEQTPQRKRIAVAVSMTLIATTALKHLASPTTMHHITDNG